LAGKPEDEVGFTKYMVEGGMEIYVADEVLSRLDPGAKELKFMLPEYGWQHLTFI